jgi:hypothetical protein
MIAAGFPKVKMGMTEIPLFVIVVEVANWIGFAVLSVCEKLLKVTITTKM